VSTFRDVIRFEQTARGAYQDLSYRPVFRSSGLFYAWVDDRIDTEISFMNYWREKNANAQVSALLTLRDAEGRRLARQYFPVVDSLYRVRVGEHVTGPFEGSLEVELHSSHDLKYTYPAIQAFYHSPDGTSFVHSNQRVFNDIEDWDHAARLNPGQTGFDVHVNHACDGFVTIINGPRIVDDARARFQIFNSRGRTMEVVHPLGDLPPYGARRMLLRDLSTVADFLGEEPGFCKVDVDAFGVFLRLLCGNIARDRSRLSVTHSYFDCNRQPEYFGPEATPADEYPCFLPFNLFEGINLDLVFYPIYAPTTLSFSLDIFDERGGVRARIDDFARLRTDGTRSVRLDVRRILADHCVEASEGLYCLHASSVDGKLPARITVGVNYRGEGLGSNISSAVTLNAGHGFRQRSYLWGPLPHRRGGKSWILVSHFNKKRDAEEEASFTVKLFGPDGPLVEKTFGTRNRTSMKLELGELLNGTGHVPQDGQILWYTLSSASPSYLAYQLHMSATGFVGADHSF
jgi:hypothetical protein